MKILGIGNVTKENLLKVLSEAEMSRYESGKTSINDLSCLYKYKICRERFGLGSNYRVRAAYEKIPKSLVEKATDVELVQLIGNMIGERV